jgi:hypothetical protein
MITWLGATCAHYLALVVALAVALAILGMDSFTSRWFVVDTVAGYDAARVLESGDQIIDPLPPRHAESDAPVHMTIERHGAPQLVEATPTFDRATSRWLLGYHYAPEIVTTRNPLRILTAAAVAPLRSLAIARTILFPVNDAEPGGPWRIQVYEPRQSLVDLANAADIAVYAWFLHALALLFWAWAIKKTARGSVKNRGP